MRLELERAPDPADRRARQPRARCHLRPRPVRRVLRRGLERVHHHLLHLLDRDRSRPTRPGLIHKSVQPQLAEPPTPLPDGRRRHPTRDRHIRVRAALRTRQHNPRAQRQRLRRGPPALPSHQLLTLLVAERQLRLRTSCSGHATAYQIYLTNLRSRTLAALAGGLLWVGVFAGGAYLLTSRAFGLA
jgi:hypothetical protein